MISLHKLLPVNLFRGANYFLIFLIVLVLINCFFAFSNVKNTEFSLQKDFLVRVLDKQNTNFGQSKYSLWTNKGLVTMQTVENYSVGGNYKIQAKFESIAAKPELNSYDWYFLSLGQQGTLKNPTKISTLSCDQLCNIIRSLTNLKNNFRLQLQYSACHTNYFVLQWLKLGSSGCQNSSNFSYSLVLGGSNGFSEDFKSQIKKVGLTHLVAFSGFQVVLIVSFVEKILLAIKLKRIFRIGLIFIVLGFTILLVGLQPPVLRSSLSIFLGTIALLGFGVRLAPLRALIYSALVLLIVNPLYIINLSFQLSFLATLGLILVPKFVSSSKLFQFKIWKIALATFCETLGAFLFTLPVILKINSGVSLIGILANLLIVPFVPILTLLNILLIVPGSEWILGLLVNLIQGLGLILVHDLVQINISWLTINWNMTFWDTIIYYSALIVVCQLPTIIHKNATQL